MREFFQIVKAEAIKQHKNYFHNKAIYISLFVWPFLNFVTAYFGYLVFDFSEVGVSYLTVDNIILYLLLGYMCLSFFTSLVQSAWQFSFERTAGTLELIFLSPANRLAVILGNALSSLFESIAVIVVFSVFIFAWHRDQLQMYVESVILVVVMLNVLAILWGVFLNALFLFSRDTDFLFTILESPMEIFSGVKVPVVLFPTWAKVLAAIFPLTYVLEAVRSSVLDGANLQALARFFMESGIIAILLLLGAILVLKCVEIHVRRTGNLTKF